MAEQEQFNDKKIGAKLRGKEDQTWQKNEQ